MTDIAHKDEPMVVIPIGLDCGISKKTINKSDPPEWFREFFMSYWAAVREQK